MALHNVRAQDKSTYLVEGESFQFRGGWVIEQVPGNKVSGNKIVRVFSSKSAVAGALTVVDIATAGEYAVWVNCPDYPVDRPGTRLFKIAVNAVELPAVGKHGKDGYYWEKAGTVKVTAGQNVLELKDMNSFGRCDAILLSSEPGFNPNNQELTALQKYRIAPVVVNTIVQNAVETASALIKNPSTPVATIAGQNIRLSFIKDESGTGNHLVAKTDIRKDGSWLNMNPAVADHKIYVISAEDPQLNYGTFFPSWSNTRGSGLINVNGKPYKVVDADNVLNPFYSGNVDEAIATNAKRINTTTIEVTYQTAKGLKLKGIWSIDPRGNHININLTATVPTAGYYSFAVAAFQSLPTDKVTNVQMPPMFQYKRLSPQAKMLTSAMMPQPLAIVETSLPTGLFSFFTAANAEALPANDWGTGMLAPYGFTLKNEQNKVQPVVFSPVLGLRNSLFKPGQVVNTSFVIGAIAAGWNNAFEYISDSIYRVKDYRHQQTSLTDAAFNMINLIKNAEASGWDSSLKGFYDIEGNPKTAPTVVQSSPLTVISAAVITRDEDFYIKRALPTIEYTLSRSGFRWATDLVPTGFNTTRKTLLLNPFLSQFTTAYYEGLYSLLGRENPWIAEITLPGNEVRKTNGYAVDVPVWTQYLAAYRLTNDNKWLERSQASADAYISKQVEANSPNPLSKGPFYNASFYANWWEFLDLYETTHQSRYLKAAESSAFHTMAGIRSYPLVKDMLQTIHPNGEFETNPTIWWKGDQLYRLGFPRVAGDAPEKQVPQALVSPVGLGFEQPETYFDPNRTVKPVYMSSWAPNLLRLYQHTNRAIFKTYSRNAVIGRFGNYPGYYGMGFTDIILSENYPYKGPDVSSIYYHHIPPHLSFTIDYLVSEAVARSGGKVHFPYSKQDGFVWFDNRIYGAGAGTIYGDKEVQLWMKKGLIAINNAEVNYVTGLSKDRFWVLLSGEADKVISFTLNISKEAGILKDANATVYAGSKTETTKVVDSKLNVRLAAKGFTAISFPIIHKPAIPVIAPVKDGLKVQDMGEPWGKVFTYRIRSPFGWDSIYGFAETAPITGASVEITYNGQTVTKASYPFEWSMVKINPKKEVVIKIKLTASGTVKEQTISMAGVN